MIIGIDGNEANIEIRVGVNVYAFELLRHIYRLSELWRGKHKFVIYLKDKPMAHMPPANSSWIYRVIPGKGVWIITKLMPTLYKEKYFPGKNLQLNSKGESIVLSPDIFFTPSHYIPPLAPMPRICSIMDLGYLEFSGQFKKYDYWQLTLWSAYSILVSKCIIAISESSKRDIVRHYPSSKRKIVVTYPGYDNSRFNLKVPLIQVKRVRDRYKIDGDYVLFLSTLKPSKNLKGLIEAMDKVIKQYQDVVLVVAGKKGWFYGDIFETVKKLGLEDKVIFTDYIPEEDKAGLIAGAKAFALPSFWEGFGLDVVSAMACGVPVVTSKVGSLPEVAGDAGITVDPSDTDSIARGILKVLTMGKMDYNRVVRAGLTQVKKFSWERMARETMEIFEKTLSQKK